MIQVQDTLTVDTALQHECCIPFTFESNRLSTHHNGDYIMVKLQEYIANNEELDIPYQPESRQKFPDGVWQDLHETLIKVLLQTTNKNDAITELVQKLVEGETLGGLTMANVLTWFLRENFQNAERVVQASMMNGKIESNFDEIVTEEVITCQDWHSAEEKERAENGETLEEHTHTLRHVQVTDENSEKFDTLVTRILQDAFPEDFGELPEEYKEAAMPDFDTLFGGMLGGGDMPAGLKEALGAGLDEVEDDVTDIDAELLGSVDLPDDDEDEKHPLA